MKSGSVLLSMIAVLLCSFLEVAADPPAAWEQVPTCSPSDYAIAHLWCNTPSDIWGSGEEEGVRGLVFRLSHNEATCFDVPRQFNTSLYGLWGASHRCIFAVGYGGVILRYDGETWMPQDHPPTGHLRGVYGTACDDVYAVGDGGIILHYDGTAWSNFPSPTGTQLEEVWADRTGQRYCVAAVGDGGDVYYYDGTEWRTIPATAGGLSGIWGTSCDSFFAVGDLGTTDAGIFYECTATSCQQRCAGPFGARPNIPQLWTVGGTSKDVYAVGAYGSIAHYDPTTGVCTSSDSGTTSFLYGICANNSHDVYVGGVDVLLHSSNK